MAPSGNEEVPGSAPMPGEGPPPWPDPVPPVPPGYWAPRAPAPTRRGVPAGRAVPVTRGDALVWLLCGAAGFIVGQIVALVAVAVAASVTGNSSRLTAIENLSAPPTWYIASGLAGLWVGFLVGPLLASRFRGTRHFVRDLRIRFRPLDLLGIAVGLGGQILVAIVYLPFISHLHNFQAPTTKLTGASYGWSFTLIAVMTVVGAPFFEELFFRGLVLRGLLVLFVGDETRARSGIAKGVAVGAAVVLDGLLFGLAHAEVQQLAGLAIFGGILALVALRTGRLGMNMVAHATFNLVAVLAIVNSRSAVIH